MSVRILVGDCLDLLRSLPDESVQACVTSPPYWGLRDYGMPGQLGLERTPDEFVAKLVVVFREVRRVLRADGTCWLNMGDCYATGAGAVGEHPGGGDQGARWKGDVGRHRDEKRRDSGRPYLNGRGEPQSVPTKNTVGPMTQPNRMPIPGLKPKDLVGVPWMLAFALRADGWWLRSDIIWHKRNPMPESTKDRPTKSHEYIFLLTKSERYYYDADAIAEPAESADEIEWAGETSLVQGAENATGKSTRRFKAGRSGNTARKPASARGVPVDTAGETNGAVAGSVPWEDVTRNKRTVWTVNTKPYPGAHFATFPPDLIEPCILAGAPKGGVVLDPFGGAGTTGLVADRNERDAILLELNPEYAAMAEARIRQDNPLFAEVEVA